MNLPPLFRFLETVSLSKGKRAQRNCNLYLDYENAKDNFKKKILFNTEEGISQIAESELVHVVIMLEKLDNYRFEEKELLQEYKDFIIDLTDFKGMQKNDYPILFRNKRAFDFFLKTLIEFNVMDEKRNPIKPFQKVINAIRKNELYKDHILVKEFQFGKYVDEVNKILDTQMSRTNLSDFSYNLTRDLNNFIKSNYLT